MHLLAVNYLQLHHTYRQLWEVVGKQRTFDCLLFAERFRMLCDICATASVYKFDSREK